MRLKTADSAAQEIESVSIFLFFFLIWTSVIFMKSIWQLQYLYFLYHSVFFIDKGYLTRNQNDTTPAQHIRSHSLKQTDVVKKICEIQACDLTINKWWFNTVCHRLSHPRLYVAVFDDTLEVFFFIFLRLRLSHRHLHSSQIPSIAPHSCTSSSLLSDPVTSHCTLFWLP